MAKKKRVPERLRRPVRERAQSRCEYCLVREEDLYYPFEADHVIAEKHGGTTTLDNLAWSCIFCNRNKGTDIASIDPSTGLVVPLFHPRKQQWKRHFRLKGPQIVPLTAGGRATAHLLQLNSELRIKQRLRFMNIGHYP
jgi:hypothetical protein